MRSLALAVALAAAACAGARARPASDLAAIEGRADLDGRPLGRRPADATVLVFFATWCGPCRAELALLGALRARRPGVRVIGLNVYEEWGAQSDARRMRGFLAAHAPWLEVVPAADDLRARFGGVPKIPTLLVYDRAGRLHAEFRRDRRPPPDAAELERAVLAASR